MPLTREQKDWALRQEGYDPASYDLDDDGFVSPRVAAQPTISDNGRPQPLPTKPSAGFLETAGREALHAAPATIMGGAGAILGGAAGGALVSGPLAPVGAVAGGLLGALGLGMGTSYAQEKIEETVAPEYTAERLQRLAERPWAGTAGRLAALPLGGMSPSLLNAPRATGDIARRVLAGQRLDAPAIANIANVGIGTGLGTGMAVGSQLAHGVPVGEALTSPETLEGFLGGAIFNKPNAIGKRMGFTDAGDAPRATDLATVRELLAQNAVPAATPLPQTGLQAAIARSIANDRKLDPLTVLNAVSSHTGPIVSEGKKGVKLAAPPVGENPPLTEQPNYVSGLLSAEEAAKQLTPFEQVMATTAEGDKSAAIAKFERQAAEELQKRQRALDFQRANAELAAQEALIAQQEAAAAQAKQQAQLQMKLGVKGTAEAIAGRSMERPELRRKSTAGLGKRVDAMEAELVDPLQDEADIIQDRLERRDQPENEGVTITDDTPYETFDTQTGKVVHVGKYKDRSRIRQAAEKRNQNWGAYRYGTRVQKAQRVNQSEDAGVGAITTEEMELARRRLAEEGIDIGKGQIPDEVLQRFVAHAKTRGVDVTIDPAHDTAGSTWLSTGLKRIAAKLNPNKATIDTPIHEGAGHAMMQFLAESPYPSDRAIVSRYKKLVSESGKLEAINAARAKAGKEPWSIDEYIASQQGVESILRDPLIAKEGEWKRWYLDFKAQIKQAFNKSTEADLRRIIDRKWHQDPAFEQYFGIKPENAAGATAKVNQDDYDAELSGDVNDGGYLNTDSKFNIPHFMSTKHVMDWIDSNITNSRDYEQFMRLALHNEILLKGEALEVRAKFDKKFHPTIRLDQPEGEGINPEEGFNTNEGDDVWSNPQEDIPVVDKTKPTPEGLEAVKALGYTYDGMQDWPGLGKWHAFTRRGDAKGAPGEGATFYAPEGHVGVDNLVALAKKKNESFGVRMDQPEGEGLEATKRAARLAQMKANSKALREKQKAELAAIRGEVGARDSGAVEGQNQGGRPPTSFVSQAKMVPLDKPLEGGGTIGDIIADPRAAMPGDTIADTKLSDIEGAPARKETVEERIARKADEQLAKLQESVPDSEAAQVVGKTVAAEEVVHAAELDQTYADMYDIVQQRIKDSESVREELVVEFGEDSDPVAKFDDKIDKQKKLLEWIATQNPTDVVNLKAIKRVNQPEDEGLAVYNKTGAVGRAARYLMAPEVEKLRVQSPKAAEAATKFYQRQRALRGKLETSTIRAIQKARPATSAKEWIAQDNPDFQAVVKWRDLKQDGIEPGFNLTATQQKINAAIEESNKLTYQERESREGTKTGKGQKPFYLGQAISRKAAKILAEEPRSVEAANYKKDFLKYRQEVQGQSEVDALKDWNTLRGQFTLTEDANLASKFGAVDKAAGLGYPLSMRETHLIDRMSRYTRRYARRMAYEDAIGGDAEVKKEFFEQDKGVASTTAGRNILEDIFGIREHNEATRSALSGIIRAAMLGPLTGAKDVVAGQVLGLQHMDYDQVIPAKKYSLENWKKNYESALKTGVVRDNVAVLELGDGSWSQVQHVLERARDITNVVQGRQLLENTARTLAFGEGKFLTLDALNALKEGNLNSSRRGFLEDFLPDWQKYKKGEVPVEAIEEAAARYVESVQGTYDYRGLPSIAMKGTLSPVISLARWNVEKLNNFAKYVVEPATKGDVKPLLMATIGAVVGGAAVEKLVEEVTGRKNRIPTWKEIGESKEKEGLLIYKLASLASMAGYSGMLGDVAKSALDRHYGNRPQTWNNPLLQGLDTAIEDLGFVKEAISEDGVNMDLLTNALDMFFNDYVQAYRVGAAHLSESKKDYLADANKRRDLKIFEMGEGLPSSRSEVIRPNPLLDTKSKEFKRTEDMGRAVELAPELIESAIQKATEEDGRVNPELLRSELSKLRRNSYQTVPSPERSPLKMMNYLDYLERTQGTDEKNRRLEDYMRRNALNRAKGSLIPSL